MSTARSSTKILCRKCQSLMLPRKSLSPSQETLQWYACSNPQCNSVSCIGDNSDFCNLSWILETAKLVKEKQGLSHPLPTLVKPVGSDDFFHLN
ncbi:MAG: hypothetical protein E6713_08050 [Sporomusaceae bacterium]|nr:hypothetical protein [Sporomusaceae bacterium]